MIKSFTLLIQILILSLLAWNTTVQAESSIHWKNEREYSILVSDNNKPLLSIVIEYLGKVPIDNKKIKHSWRTIDTDFYRETFKNLSSSNITIKEMSYFLDRGQLQTPRIKGEKKIKATYGTSFIKANETLLRNNAWVWATKENTLHRIFVFTLDDKKFDVDIPLVYLKINELE